MQAQSYDEALECFVFSYNRGAFLKNCIDSITACAPRIKTTILDDGSDDAETLQVLDEAKKHHDVLTTADPKDNRHGGLYHNMRLAVEKYASRRLVLLLQDDVQIVRRLSADDLDYISGFFEHHFDAAFLSPSFLRQSAGRRLRSTVLSDGFPVYFTEHDDNNAFYSDICIAHRERLQDRQFSFAYGEQLNGARAKGLFSRMGLMAHPFAAWLPFVPNYRGKVETVAMRLARHFYTVGFFPFETMDERQSLSFKQRDLARLPIAEDFLVARGLSADDRPWFHDPLAVRKWLQKLNRSEMSLRRRARRVEHVG